MREKYFDGKKISWKYRNPWKQMTVLNGTDALSFHPILKKEENPWIYLDDLYRTGSFVYQSTKDFFKFRVNRYL